MNRICRTRIPWPARGAFFAAILLVVLALASWPSGRGSQSPPQTKRSRDVHDPAVPSRSAQVVKFFEQLGFRLLPSDSPYTWKWDLNRSGKYYFTGGHFRAEPVEPQPGKVSMLLVAIANSIEDPGSSANDIDSRQWGDVWGGYAAPADDEFRKYVPIPGRKVGVWVGSNGFDKMGAIACGSICIWALGPRELRVYRGRSDESPLNLERRRQILEYLDFIPGYLIGFQEKLCAAGLCRCGLPSIKVEIMDGNPTYNDKFDFTDERPYRKLVDKREWFARAHTVAANAKTKRVGAAADGISLLIFKCEVPERGTMQFIGTGAGLQSSLSEDGALFAIADGPPVKKGGLMVDVPIFEDEYTGQKKYWAAVLYLPPKSFGPPQESRNVKFYFGFTGESGKKSEGSFEIKLVPPPVVLVHGTFDNPKSCWETTTVPDGPYTMRQRLESQGYRLFLTDWTDSSGQKNPSSFLYNCRAVWKNKGGIKEALETFRGPDINVAVTQADVVAHSQGGVIARMYARGSWGRDVLPDDDYHFTSPRDCAETCEYHRPDNFAAGDIHRLITISTTHYGSDICRLLEAYRYFVDNRSWAGDATLSWWNAFLTEAILSLHSGREVEILRPAFLERGWVPWTNYPVMWFDAFSQKVDIYKPYAFTEGFRDQIPGSDGLARLMKTRVPSHAIACVADDRDMLELNLGYYQQRLELMWYLSSAEILAAAFQTLGQTQDAEDLVKRKRAEDDLVARADLLKKTNRPEASSELAELGPRIAESRRLNAARLRSAAFGNDENDCTVRKASSLGGLAPQFTTVLPHVLHGPAPRYLQVQQRVLDLLQNDGSLFAPDGFPAAGVMPRNPSYSGPAAPSASSQGSRPKQSEGLTDAPKIPKAAEPDKLEAKVKPPAQGGNPPPTAQAPRAILASDGSLELVQLGCKMQRRNGVFVITDIGLSASAFPDLLKSGAVLKSIFDMANGAERNATSLSAEDLARILNAPGEETMVVLKFVLPDGESRDIPHPGRLFSK